MARSKAMPVSALTDLFRSWPNNNDLEINKLRAKSLALLALVCMLRPSDVAPGAELFNPETNTTSGFEFTVNDVEFLDDHMLVNLHGIKNDYQRRGFQVKIHRATEPLVCPVLSLQEYIDRTSQWRTPDNQHVFLALNSPHKGLTAKSIAKILNKVIEDAGLTGYSAKDFRPTGATSALQAGIHDAAVMKVGRWKSVDVFREHYVHFQTPVDFTDKIIAS